MSARVAACSCGSLTATAEGEPVRISVCHCLECKRRTGSAFGYNAHWPKDRVRTSGPSSRFLRTSDEGYWVAQSFCPSCGSTVFYEIERRPGILSIPVGGFAEPDFPPPTVAVYSSRKNGWVAMPDALVQEE
jgi:hypothetical protein